MKHLWFFCFLLLFQVNSFAQDTIAQDTTMLVPDSLSIDTLSIGSTKEFEQSKTRPGKIYWDSHIRLRHEFWNNQEDLNDDLDDLYSFFRLKLYLGGGLRPTENIQLYARIVNESRYYGHKGTGDSIRNDHLYRPERHYFELVVGQLFFTWTNIGGKPLALKVGRQNLHNQGFGNQWLIGDGTPMDGSKTFYYNAARLTYRFNTYTSLDVVGLLSFADDPMVIYSEAEKTVTNITDEQGGWIWFKHRFNENFPYRAYYLYKHENGGGDYHRLEESGIHTLGLHLKPETENVWLDGQVAIQGGSYGSGSRSGFGTILYGGFQLKKEKWSLKAGPWYLYLSGNDPESENFGAFNNLYGGYPNDDELYLNTLARESGVSMYTNLNLLGAYLEFKQPSKYNIRFWYHLMKANHLVEGDFFGEGKNRGHMIMLKAMAEVGKNLKLYYMFEYLWTGDFHFTGADNAILSRLNLEWHF